MKDVLIFDLDGTLLNTIEDIADSLNTALSKHGFQTYTVEQVKRFVGSGVRMMVERALPSDDLTEENITHVQKEYMIVYKEKQSNKTRPYDGLVAVIDQLRVEGFKIAVLSNKPHQDTLKVVDHYFGLDRFDIVVGQQQGVPIKPHPFAVFQILQTLHCLREHSFYIGDSDVDMQTAKNAEMDSIAVTWGFRSEEELQKYHPTLLVHSAKELLNACLNVRKANQ